MQPPQALLAPSSLPTLQAMLLNKCYVRWSHVSWALAMYNGGHPPPIGAGIPFIVHVGAGPRVCSAVLSYNALMHTVPSLNAYLSGTFVVRQHGGFWHFFLGFVNFWSNAPKIRPIGGAMCIPFEMCEKRPFQKCMGQGGGG